MRPATSRHRRQQRQAAVARRSRSRRRWRCTPDFEQAVGLLGIRRQVQVGEEHLARAQHASHSAGCGSFTFTIMSALATPGAQHAQPSGSRPRSFRAEPLPDRSGSGREAHRCCSSRIVPRIAPLDSRSRPITAVPTSRRYPGRSAVARLGDPLAARSQSRHGDARRLRRGGERTDEHRRHRMSDGSQLAKPARPDEVV